MNQYLNYFYNQLSLFLFQTKAEKSANHTKLPLILCAISSLLLINACAHHRDVRPGSDGVNLVVLMNEEKNFDGREALSQAEHYCESLGRRAVIVSEKNNYVGSMDESSYNNTKTGAKVAQAVGGAGYAFGGKKESELGGVIGLGGVVANEVIGQGYRYEMSFKCQ